MCRLRVIEVLGASDLGSRHNGKLLREEIEVCTGKGLVVSLDFAGVDLVTQSFIDEAVGVLIREIGPSFSSKIRVMNCADPVKTVIRLVATYSLQMFSRGGDGSCAVRETNRPLCHSSIAAKKVEPPRRLVSRIRLQNICFAKRGCWTALLLT